MSNPRARKGDRYGRITAERRQRDVRADRAARLRAWLAGYVERTDPAPGQRPDTRLGDHYGDLNLIEKRSNMATLSLPITQISPSSDGGWILTAQGAAGAALRKAFRTLKKRAVGQMANSQLPKAGSIIAASIDGGDGKTTASASLTARITDGIAAEKVRRSVYPMLSITTAGNEVLAVDLIDTDAVSKGGSNRQVIILKLYESEGSSVNMNKASNKLARQLGVPVPIPTQIRKATPAGAALASQLLATPIVPDAGDPETRQFAQSAALTLIKAARERGPIRDPRLTMTAGR
jgi:hypothetical protein